MRLCKQNWTPALSIAVVIPIAMIALTAGCSGRQQADPDSTANAEPESRIEQPATQTTPPEGKGDDRRRRETQVLEQPVLQGMTSSDSLEESAGALRKLSRADMAALAPSAAVVEPGRVCCPGNIRHPSEPLDRENYDHFDENPVKLVSDHPVSTFSIDVDTGSYSNVRRFLNGGTLPPEDAVRVEELINYFSYDYPVPDSLDQPFSVSTDVAAAPWNADKLLLQIGIKGYELSTAERKSANLVFLVDVSGSMNSQDKLPLLKNALKMLTRQLSAEDRVSMVVYAGASGIVLEPTAGDEHARISRALDQLTAGGRTNGASGIRMAYDMAEEGFIEGGINRVVLATDGDFNVGTVDFDALIDIVERERKVGTSLTTLGFGSGNYNDHLMEQLADAGNGNHAYIDTLNEARKVLVDQLGSTLQTIAKDVKIQVEFNPAVVAEYRLIGYENRVLRREDFNNDKIDAGEIGAGHTVTAIYELALVDSSSRLIDPLRYGQESTRARDTRQGELAFVRLRHKAPGGDKSRLQEFPVRADVVTSIDKAGDELRFAASVAAFGQLLRGDEFTGDFAFADVIELATSSRGKDRHGYRSEFVNLARLAESLSTAQDGRQARR